MIERRSSSRIRASIPVEIENGHGVTIDISGSGVYLVAEGPPPTSATLTFTLVFGAEQTKPSRVECHATIIRVDQRSNGFGLAATLDAFGADDGTPVGYTMPLSRA